MMKTSAQAYTECLEAMYGLRRFGIKLGLDTIRRMLAGLGDPQRRFATIHVAGTNGKGSIASALATILTTAGYRTGLYTSPHLVRFNERIRIDGAEIPDERVLDAYRAVKGDHQGTREPTFFEFATAMALYEFGQRQVDWAVIETGMGGRLDATNVITPAVAVISNISIEHKAYLGDSIARITAEKGGIIKPGVPVVTGVTQKAAVDVLTEISRRQKAPLLLRGKHFRTRRMPDGTFTYYGVEALWPAMRTSLVGNFQQGNAALTLAACEQLVRQGTALPLEAIRSGLAHNHWAGRLEVVRERPRVILDGAHNLIAARNLARFLADNFKGRRITLVIGILDDKPYAAMLKCLLPVCRRAIFTRPAIDRALPPERLAAAAKGLAPKIEVLPEVAAAVTRAIDSAAPEDVVCIAGSLYLVGDAKKVLP